MYILKLRCISELNSDISNPTAGMGHQKPTVQLCVIQYILYVDCLRFKWPFLELLISQTYCSQLNVS